jgi:hypothetical protein
MTTTQTTTISYTAERTKNGWYNIVSNEGTVVEKVRGYSAYTRAEVLTCGHAIRTTLVASYRFKDGRDDVCMFRMSDGTYQCDALPESTCLSEMVRQVHQLGECSKLL